MSFQVVDLVNKSKPIIIEGFLIIIIGLLIVGNTAVSDIIFHDKYVKPVIAECYAENQSTFCKEVRADHQVAIDAQLEIGEAYWNELARQAIVAGVILFVIRISFAIMLAKAGVRKIRMTSIFMALFWGLVGSGFFLFGYVDTFYYWFVFESPPPTLEWLDGAGLFVETKTFTGTVEHVEIMDLYLTNILGLIVIGSFWVVIMFMFAESGLSRRNIG